SDFATIFAIALRCDGLPCTHALARSAIPEDLRLLGRDGPVGGLAERVEPVERRPQASDAASGPVSVAAVSHGMDGRAAIARIPCREPAVRRDRAYRGSPARLARE